MPTSQTRHLLGEELKLVFDGAVNHWYEADVPAEEEGEKASPLPGERKSAALLKP